MPDLVLDHVGIQVKDLDEAVASFARRFGYRQATRPVLNTRQKVRVVFLEKEGSLPIKLFQPVDPSAVRGTASLHHLAFRAGDLDGAIAALTGDGGRLISPPQPGEAFDDEPIAFVFTGGLNVELIATEKRRDRI